MLSELRSRVSGGAEELLLTALLTVGREQKLLTGHARQRTDSTHVPGAVRALNRIECVGATFRAALNALAVAAPDWLRAHSNPLWVERYTRRIVASCERCPTDRVCCPPGETAEHRGVRSERRP